MRTPVLLLHEISSERSDMSNHSIETYDREDGKRGWRAKVGDNIVATDGGQGYNNEEDALSGFFNLFFGSWDTSFLGEYEKWQAYAGQQENPAPEPYIREAANEHLAFKAAPVLADDLGDESDPVETDIAGNPSA